nr:hemagglutinin repeat-containing protein [Enterobacter kobei]
MRWLGRTAGRGKTVVADIGRNLAITSEQDTDRYDSKQQNASAGGSFTFGTMSGSASVNYSRDIMNSDYASVKEQTGIFAGSGGFDIVEDRSGNGNRWEYINKPFIEDITLSKKEVDIIMADVKKYAEAFLNE